MRFPRLISLMCSGLMAGSFAPILAYAQTPQDGTTHIPVPALNQDMCISAMADFPTDDAAVRYQFFRLSEDMALGATPEFKAVIGALGQPEIEAGQPVLDVIEDMADPVLRQAMPEKIVASADYLIDFAQDCAPYISGQVESLLAFDNSLGEAEFNAVISEDALFLRQILSESLSRLGVDDDAHMAPIAAQYAASLVTHRNAIEYKAYETELAGIEALFLEDLDGRLARSNDMINSGMDREILGDSVQLSTDMSESARAKTRDERLYRLVRIFGGGY